MDKIMLLLPSCLIKVISTYENQIARFHLTEFEVNWQSIILIGLIPVIQFEPKFFLQVEHHLAYESTAIKEERRVVKCLSWTVVLFSIRNAKVILASIDELLP